MGELDSGSLEHPVINETESTRGRLVFISSQLLESTIKADSYGRYIKERGQEIDAHPQGPVVRNTEGLQSGYYQALLALEKASRNTNPVAAGKLSALRDLARYNLTTEPGLKELPLAQKKAALVHAADGIQLNDSEIAQAVKELQLKHREAEDRLKQHRAELPPDQVAKLEGLVESYGSVLYLLDAKKTDKVKREFPPLPNDINKLELYLGQGIIGLQTLIVDALHDGIGKKELDETIDYYQEELDHMWASKDMVPGADAALEDYQKKLMSVITRYRDEQERLIREPNGKDLKEVIKKYNVFLTHALNPDLKGGLQNARISTGANWQDKLDIVLAVAPTIATASFREGDTLQNLFGPMGVLIIEGAIPDARAEDAFSATGEGNNRKTTYYYKNIDEKIEEAIEMRNPDGYNEIFVNNPGVGRFFICEDDGGWSDMPTPEQIFLKTSYLQMPVCIISNGKVLEAEYDHEIKNWRKGKEISPQEISTQKYTLPESVKAEVEQNAKVHMQK